MGGNNNNSRQQDFGSGGQDYDSQRTGNDRQSNTKPSMSDKVVGGLEKGECLRQRPFACSWLMMIIQSRVK